MTGKKSWYFPDAELPPMGGDPGLFGHESIIVLNPNSETAAFTITLYYTDKEPVVLPQVTLEGRRVVCIRATEKDGILGVAIAEGEQYAIGIESDTPVVAQYGRLDMRTGNMAFYTTPGYCE